MRVGSVVLSIKPTENEWNGVLPKLELMVDDVGGGSVPLSPWRLLTLLKWVVLRRKERMSQQVCLNWAWWGREERLGKLEKWR